jgi:aryl-alcohol dehydrogenase-like predicted oxidoreductase
MLLLRRDPGTAGSKDRRDITMEYRTHQDLSISEIGVGCYALSGAYGPRSPDDFARVLERARERGVNFFDAAGSYGDAETVLGRVMRPHRRYVCIATKVALRAGATPDLSAVHIRASCEESLRRLETDWIDLLQIHYDEPDRPIEEVIGTLESLAREGKIRRYGVGHVTASRVAGYAGAGRPFSAMMEFSAISRHAAREILPVCRRSQVAGIAFGVTGRGLLSAAPPSPEELPDGDIRQMDPLFRRERWASARRVAAKMATIGSREGRTVAQVAFAWVLAQEGILCALTGPSSLAHLDENLCASGWRIDPASARELETFLAGEDAWVRAEQERSLTRILDSPLPGDARVAFADLVYAIETAILLGRAGETELLPLFRELFGLRSMTDRGISPRLESLRSRLRTRIAT